MACSRLRKTWLHAAAVGSILAAALAVFAVSCDYGDLDHIPPGFADGVDNQVYFEGTGPELGVADTAARSDHAHDADYVLKAGDTMTGPLEVQGEVKSVVAGREFYMVPRGAIIMWSGALADVPAGWQLCDGTNGAPNLQDRFILGTAAAEEPGSPGGAHSLTLTTAQTPQHVHSFTTGNNDVDHDHLYDVPRFSIDGRFGGGQDAVTSYFYDPYYSDANNRDHRHPGTTDAMPAAASFDNRPAFYKLAFIMKL
jgi:hypothetical protein